MAEKYKVIKRFREVKHDGHIYKVNDYYPVEGKRATKARIAQLLTTNNKENEVFIVEVGDEVANDQ
ncbi:termination factor Rho [Lysinibacillus sphaericus]|uniref:Termination factor Rho n=1 Tax=Lysinibacillus sphaericus TaxID=1421 RepID=A0A544U8A3_LYSSH|nr:termination factor Rho [Lysinibacillus sp. SDF0037]TQR28326.1 termination factor Rho [Lysinibacillus sp. SDF0037]